MTRYSLVRIIPKQCPIPIRLSSVMSVKPKLSAFHHRASPYLLLSVCLALAICLTTYLITSRDAATGRRNETAIPETTTPQGKLRGICMETIRRRKVSSFLGVPYARPPVGDLRFRAPLPPDPWNETWDASTEASPCVQFDPNLKPAGDEDCLYLNVFSPQLPQHGNSTLMPVLVNIIGGRFQYANTTVALFGPDFLLDKDVILVVPNFRVSVLGYLSTGDEASPGNNGMKDLVRALEWVRDNIEYFGGDPRWVTVAGQSSGATSVSLLAMSDATKGLFHRSIEMSGSAPTTYAPESNEVAVKRAFALGAHLGCPTDTSTTMVNCLRGLTAHQILNTTLLFSTSDLVPGALWVPTVEADVGGAFLTESPWKIIASGKLRDIPTIYNVVPAEGLSLTARFYVNPDEFEQLLNNIDYLLPHLAMYANAVANVTAFTEALKSYYLNDLTTNRSLLVENVTQVVGDVTFAYPAYRSLYRKIQVGVKSPQYFCSFEHRGVLSRSYHFTHGSTKDIGVPHSETSIYLFPDHNHMYGPPGYERDEADWKMVDTMVGLWTSFVTHGRPYAPGPNGENIWEPYDSRENYLRIGHGREVGLDVKYAWNQQRMEFMDELFKKTEWK